MPGISEENNTAAQTLLPYGCLAGLFFLACASGRFQVTDAEFFTDGLALDRNTMQIVESHEDSTLLLPAAERHARNCAAAEARARSRYRAAYPGSRDEGIRLSERFDKNAGCTVRMAFRRE